MRATRPHPLNPAAGGRLGDAARNSDVALALSLRTEDGLEVEHGTHIARRTTCTSSTNCASIHGRERARSAVFGMPPARPRRTLSPPVRAEILKYQQEQLRYLTDWLRFRRLSQKHIANALGVSEGVISRYISGKAIMAVGTLRKIAVLLQASEGDLIQPPDKAGLAPQVEETLTQMDRLGPERWARILATAKDMKGRDEK